MRDGATEQRRREREREREEERERRRKREREREREREEEREREGERKMARRESGGQCSSGIKEGLKKRGEHKKREKIRRYNKNSLN